MKRSASLLRSSILMCCIILACSTSVSGNRLSPPDSVIVYTTPELYALSCSWANGYGKQHPGQGIKVVSMEGQLTSGDMASGNGIGIVSGVEAKSFGTGTTSILVVGRDIIVPVFNSNNPYMEEITRTGVIPGKISAVVGEKLPATWGSLIGGDRKEPVSCFVVDENEVRDALGGLSGSQAGIAGAVPKSNSDELISAIRNNPSSIGFCRFADILGKDGQSLPEGIRLLPLDRNSNGIIDHTEQIYSDAGTFARGVWIGKYPSVLVRNIYVVFPAGQSGSEGRAFIKWILNDGQEMLFGSGYSYLMASERQSSADRLMEAGNVSPTSTKPGSALGPFLVLIAVLVAAGLILEIVIRYSRRNRKPGVDIITGGGKPIDETSLSVPGGIYYDKTHTWAFMEKNGSVRVGVDDFLQRLSGTVTRVKLRETGETIKKGESILSIIRNGKQLNLYSPVSGVIKMRNSRLETNASLINSSPYDEGWAYIIEPANWFRENQLLFAAEKHIQFIRNEIVRLKDFLAEALKDDSEKYARVILQDGGELRDGILADLEPEIWEEFQNNFIDPSRQLWFYELY